MAILVRHKIQPRRKRGRCPGLKELPKTLGFPFNISATAEGSDFKFGTQLGFAKAHHTVISRRKVGTEAIQNLGVFNC